MRADASDVAKGDTPLNGQFNWGSSVFDRVADGYLFATHRDRQRTPVGIGDVLDKPQLNISPAPKADA